MLDLRFPTALQAMLSLALAEESGISRMNSTELADGLGANPSLVRRLLRPLVEHGLLVSTVGKSGGVGLARPAGDITLAEIYTAATEGKTLWVPRVDIPHRCVVTSNVEAFFTDLARKADSAVIGALGTASVADALAEIRALDRRRADVRPGRSPPESRNAPRPHARSARR
jgi:Rrf2 family transcriptional repressor of oqxAB